MSWMEDRLQCASCFTFPAVQGAFPTPLCHSAFQHALYATPVEVGEDAGLHAKQPHYPQQIYILRLQQNNFVLKHLMYLDILYEDHSQMEKKWKAQKYDVMVQHLLKPQSLVILQINMRDVNDKRGVDEWYITLGFVFIRELWPKSYYKPSCMFCFPEPRKTPKQIVCGTFFLLPKFTLDHS